MNLLYVVSTLICFWNCLESFCSKALWPISQSSKQYLQKVHHPRESKKCNTLSNNFLFVFSEGLSCINVKTKSLRHLFLTVPRSRVDWNCKWFSNIVSFSSLWRRVLSIILMDRMCRKPWVKPIKSNPSSQTLQAGFSILLESFFNSSVASFSCEGFRHGMGGLARLVSCDGNRNVSCDAFTECTYVTAPNHKRRSATEFPTTKKQTSQA